MSEEISEKRKKKSAGQLLYTMVPVAAVLSMLIFGGLYLREYLQYRAAEEEYAALADTYIQEDGDASSAVDTAGEDSALTHPGSGASTENASPNSNSSTSTQDGTSKNLDSGTSMKQGSTSSRRVLDYPALSIDYDALLRVNADFACVLYIPALHLRYPVVYSKDNADYLHTTFEGKHNAAGAIFYDCTSPKNFRAKNTFLFGHNMKNGSMFGTLKKLKKDSGLAATDPYIYIYTKDHVRIYRIFSYYDTVDGSAGYDDFSGNEGYDQYVAYCLKNSVAARTDTAMESTEASAAGDDEAVRRKTVKNASEDAIDFAKRPPLLTLSTCSGRAGGSERFVVHAALVGTA